MRMHKVDVDQDVFDFLKNNAEPFIDTPNDVLRRLLLGNVKNKKTPSKQYERSTSKYLPSVTAGTPKALEHVLQVAYLTCFIGISRTKATKDVAILHGVAPQTVLDKYCRQLEITASEFDRLLSETELRGLKEKLYSNFPDYENVIDEYLNKP